MRQITRQILMSLRNDADQRQATCNAVWPTPLAIEGSMPARERGKEREREAVYDKSSVGVLWQNYSEMK
jgi:hypothetical protein